jgi:hypothetical protein
MVHGLVVNAVIMRRTSLVTFLGDISLTNGNQMQCWCYELKIHGHAKIHCLFGCAIIVMVSCTSIKTQYPISHPEADGKQKGYQIDFEILKGWTEEERRYFIDHFVYKSIELRNDTLVFVR